MVYIYLYKALASCSCMWDYTTWADFYSHCITYCTEKCRFCMGAGTVTVELGGDEKEVSNCINCDGAGSLTCTTCQGSGIQPRYLDRRYEIVIEGYSLSIVYLLLGT